MTRDWFAWLASISAAGFVLLTIPPKLLAHCDGIDGPVVAAAQKALEAGNVNGVLIWVQKTDEAEIRKAFEKTLAVRKLSSGAKELADMYFFETLVRVHRIGEGAPYTGLKPAGRDLGPAIPAADRAVGAGSLDPLLVLLTDEVRGGAAARFKQLNAKKSFRPDDVDAGREYVNAYVEFIHYVEGIHQAGTNPADGHFEETPPLGSHGNGPAAPGDGVAPAH